KLSDTAVDLRVEDHQRPIEELQRIYRLHQAIFGETPRDRWVQVDDALAQELRERLVRLGYEGELGEAFLRWAGNENLEERVDGIVAVDPVVLEELRSR
nr:fimbrial assembly protein FimA [Actinomycetota bacterium]